MIHLSNFDLRDYIALFLLVSGIVYLLVMAKIKLYPILKSFWQDASKMTKVIQTLAVLDESAIMVHSSTGMFVTTITCPTEQIFYDLYLIARDKSQLERDLIYTMYRMRVAGTMVNVVYKEGDNTKNFLITAERGLLGQRYYIEAPKKNRIKLIPIKCQDTLTDFPSLKKENIVSD